MMCEATFPNKLRYILKNWCVRSDASPYQPPELAKIYLSGEVYDHPAFPEGKRISTSNIKEINGPYVTTNSGSVYLLDEPDPKFVKFCEENGVHVPTKEVPIKAFNNG